MNFSDEIDYLQKNMYSKSNLFPDKELFIPEFKIELFNKSKKLINVIENLKDILDDKKNL